MPLVYREALPVQEPSGTVLCLHGYPESSYMWRHLLESVSDAGWQAVAPDLPGYGDSPYGGSGTWRAHVDAIDAFHREQELGEVVLVMHDWGGLIGLRWACEHPELIRAMVISNTGFFADGKWHGMADMLRTPGQGEQLVDGLDRDGFAAMLRSVSPSIDDRSIDEYFKAYGSPERRRGQLELYRSGEFSELKDYDLGGTVKAPALILWGEDDPFAPVAGAHRFDRELADSSLVVVPGAKHFIFDDEPERCSAEVVAFLGRIG
jgi:haloalkane dehalogenase